MTMKMTGREGARAVRRIELEKRFGEVREGGLRGRRGIHMSLENEMSALRACGHENSKKQNKKVCWVLIE